MPKIKLSDLRWRSALLEGLAVLTGIILAFTIDAWWDLRSQRSDLEAYLVAVNTELKANRQLVLDDLGSLREWTDTTKGYLEEIVAIGADPDYDAVRRMIWKNGPNQTNPLLRAAVDDLISSGGINLIESPELRRSVARYIRALDGDAVEQENVRQNFRQFMLPYHLQHGSFADYDWEEYVGVKDTEASFPIDLDAFVGNRDYANLLVSRVLGYANLRDSHSGVLAAIDETLEHISESSSD